jgi:hypothetical protein
MAYIGWDDISRGFLALWPATKGQNNNRGQVPWAPWKTLLGAHQREEVKSGRRRTLSRPRVRGTTTAQPERRDVDFFTES